MAEDLDRLLGVNPTGNTNTSLDQLLGLSPSQESLSPLDKLLGLEVPSAPVSEPGIFSELGGGLQRGVRGLKTEGLGLGAVLADLFGAEDIALELGALAQANQLEIQQTIPRAVEFENAFDSPGNFALFAASALGEQVPIIASIILSGGIGGIVGRLIGKRILSKSAAEMALSKFGARGFQVGVVGGAAAIETGATATEQFGAIGEINAGVALTAGLAKGALEAIVPFAFARNFGLLPSQADDFLARVFGALNRIPSRAGRAGVTAVAASVVEGTTEFLQEAIDIAARDFVDANYDALGPETRMRFLESAFTGALVGFMFGGLGGALTSRGPEPLTENVADAATVEAGLGEAGVQVGVAVPPVDLPPDATAIVGRRETPDVGTAFERPDIAFDTEAVAGKRDTQAFTLDASKAQLTAEDVTADVFGLPTPVEDTTEALKNIFEGDTNVTLVNPETGLDALTNARSAVSTMEGFYRDVAQGEGVLAKLELSNAKAFLNEAERLGFRYKPSEQGGFKVLKEVPKEAFVPVKDVPFDTTFAKHIARFAPILLGAPAQTKGLEFKPPSGRTPINQSNQKFYSIDFSRLKPEQVSASLLSVEEVLQLSRGKIPKTITVPKALKEELLNRYGGGILPGAPLLNLQDFIDRGLRIEPRPSAPFVLTENISPPLLRIETQFPTRRGSNIFEMARGDRNHIKDWVENAEDTLRMEGGKYKESEHKKGKVEIIVDAFEFGKATERDEAFFKTAKSSIERLLKVLNLQDERILLHIGVGSKIAREVLTPAGGRYASLGGVTRAHLIELGLPSEKTTFDSSFLTLYHEFGHFLTYVKLAKEKPDVQEAIWNAFLRSNRAGVYLSYDEMASRMFSPIQGGRNLADPNIQAWYDFDEFIAEQVARWAVTSRRATTVLDKFLQEMVRALRIAWKHIRKLPIRDFAAEPEIQSWLDDMIARKDAGDIPVSMQAAEWSVAESKVKNTELLDMPLSIATPQDQGAAREVKHSVSSLLPPKGVEPENEGEATPPKELGAELDRFNVVSKWGFSILQLAKRNPHIAGLMRYVEHARQWYNLKMRWISRADARVKEITSLGKQQVDALGKLLFDVDVQVYLQEGEKARWPTAEELAALVQEHGVSEQGFATYLNIVQDLADFLEQVQSSSEKDAHNTFTDDVLLNAELRKIQTQMDLLRETPYFPHSRFGDYTIVVRDKDGIVVFMQQFESKKARTQALPKVLKGFPVSRGFATREDSMPKEVEVFRGIPPSLLKALKTKINLTEEQRIWLDAIIFESAPAQSFKKRFIKRIGIPGFSDNAVRSYANYFFHGANHLARIEFDGDLRSAIAEVEAETAEMAKIAGANLDKRRGIIDFMRQHHSYIMQPQNDWAHLRSAAFSFYLGFNVSSALINLTQVPLVAYPYLAARYTDLGALNELRKATLDLHKIYNAKEQKIPEDEFWFINLGVEQGWLDESQATELAAVAEGSNLQRALPGTKTGQTVRMVGSWAAFMFQSAEKLNRRVVSRAAYRLAKANPEAAYLRELKAANELLVEELRFSGRSEAEALAFLAARDAVEETQFEYASAFKPRFMQGKRGVLFTFFMFQQQMLYYARFTPGRGRFLLALLATAGFMGLPGMEDLESLVNFMGRKLFGSDYNAEREARRLMIELGIENPDLLLHGASRYGMGMGVFGDLTGIPLPNMDLSARLSLGRVVPGLQGLTQQGDFERTFTEGLTDISGAAFNIPINVMRSLADGHPDVFKRWERSMPTALRNVSKAMRFFREEAATGRKGEELVPFDIHDAQDIATIVAQGLGFAPTELSQRWDRDRMRKEAERYWTVRQGILFAQFDWARLAKDREAIADVRAAIRRYNNEVPFGGLRIGSRNLRASAKGRQRARVLSERGLPLQRSRRGLARDINELFPEVIAEENVR